MKTNIKMKCDDSQFRKVMNILKIDYKSYLYYEDMYIIINNDLNVDFGYGGTIYNDSNCKEIDADLFIRTNGTCEEKISKKIMKENTENLETFIKKNNYENISDLKRIIVLTANKHDILEIKLKKKNEILKKARIKRKNQREELNKLNLKLQKCISLEEHQNIVDRLNKENIEMGKLVNLNKSALDLAVMTKDLAMKTVREQNKEIEKLKVVIEYLESKVK